jgi:hypothetical protein
VAVQVQPPWRYGGSHTVFANQLDALHDRGWFVIRIFVDSDAGSGPTLRRRMAPVLADGTSDAAPHLEAVACAPGAPETHGSDQGDRYLLRELRSRTWATITDDALVARLAARAEIAVVNYIVHMGFALKACPAARLVLETHDDLTRNALTRSRLVGGPATFPTLGPLRRHAALERLIWRTADVCIALSLSELPRIRRHAPTAYVLPRPYARRALPADGEVLWDILVVMNAHHFNIPALDAFLEHVIAADPALAVRRVAIVGRIDTVLAPAWRDRLPQTQWLGYVADIDALRDRARLSVCPDLAGTGVAIKTLTAIAAGHPLVATSVALRGLAPAILDLLPPADTVVAMRRQIAALLDDPQALAARRAAVARARDLLWPAAGHGPALDAARAATRDAAPARARLAAALAEAPAPTEADDAGAETITIRFGAGGNDRPRLGTGWLHDEPGGRWSDGGTAILRLPAAWFAAPRWLALSVMEDFRGAAVGLTHDGVPLRALAAGPGLVWLALDRARPGADGLVELALVCPETLCPREAGLNHDERVLGVHVRTLEIVAPYSRVLPATAAEDAGVGRPPLRRRMAAIARKAADHARAMLAPR